MSDWPFYCWFQPQRFHVFYKLWRRFSATICFRGGATGPASWACRGWMHPCFFFYIYINFPGLPFRLTWREWYSVTSWRGWVDICWILCNIDFLFSSLHLVFRFFFYLLLPFPLRLCASLVAHFCNFDLSCHFTGPLSGRYLEALELLPATPYYRITAFLYLFLADLPKAYLASCLCSAIEHALVC